MVEMSGGLINVLSSLENVIAVVKNTTFAVISDFIRVTLHL